VPRVELAAKDGTVVLPHPADAAHVSSVVPLTTSETVFQTVSLPVPVGTPLAVVGLAVMLMGASSTTVSLRIRRDSLAGTTIGVQTIYDPVASKTEFKACFARDVTIVSPAVYVFTASQNVAGDGDVDQVLLLAIPLVG